MSTYVIGDIQGCYRELRSLLDKINLDPQEDELWLVGDLINRGPDNVAVLDCLMEIPRLIAVLGNHDLHFLAIAGEHMTQKRNDTLDDLLSSPGLPQYVEWLKRLPLIHHDPIKNCVLVHAGLPPQLSLESCLALAGESNPSFRRNEASIFSGRCTATSQTHGTMVWQDSTDCVSSPTT